MVRLLRLLDRPEEAAVIEPLIRHEILFRLLQGAQGGLMRQLATPGSHLAQAGRAADWIRRNYDKAFSIKTLADEACMSVKSFHRHFKAVTRMSPLRYRTQIRLQEARRLMVASDRPVEQIGFRVGYESASQFSRDSRQMFGAPPGADSSRLRSEAKAPFSSPDRSRL